MPISLLVLLLTFTSQSARSIPHIPDTTRPYLDPAEVVVTDSSAYASFHVKVINPGDSLVAIESIQPSCGCLLATIQNSNSTRQRPADIYVAVTTARMDTLQPITIDVFTNRTGSTPLRLTIRKRNLTQSAGDY